MADAIGLVREGNRIYVTGNNDESHYFAVAELLGRWGCRWYLPTDLGECIPEATTLTVGTLDHVYGSPFEIRSYWISWNDDAFEWDVDLSGKLRAGKNTLALRANCEHHFGGMFRRPFLYAPGSK